MKKLILSLLAVATSINLFGWELNLGLNAGLRIGLNGSNVIASGEDSDLYEKGDMQLGFNLGAFYDWEINDCFYIQPMLSYTTRGTDLSTKELENKIKIGYLQLPLLASYRFNLGEKHKFALNCGPTVGYAIVGKNQYELYDLDGSKVEYSADLFSDESGYNRLEIGVNMGVSYFLKNHYINITWERGLSSIYDFEGCDCKLKNNNIAITVGYTF